jgi:hypothetical protein
MLSLSIMTVAAQATIPETINYQGYLTDISGNPVNTTVSMTFRIYTVASGGAALWTETQNNVPVTNGIYHVILGSMESMGALAFDVPYFLGITVGSDSEMTPRQALTSVAYAFNADTANTALNVASNVITSTMIQNGTVLSEDVNFNYAGSTSKGGPATSLACTGCVTQGILADNAVNSAKIENGQILFADIGGNSCTNGQVMKWNGSAWGCSADTNTTYSAGIGLDLNGNEFRVETPLALSGSSAGAILLGQNTGINGIGVHGYASATTGETYGIAGVSDSNKGSGVYGYASAGIGVYGESSSTRGVYGYASAPTGETYGVYGLANSPDGYGGYFSNIPGGVALKAAGSGVIQSSAKSYVWISGNGVRKYRDVDSTIIDMTNFGGAVVQRGATAGNKNVMLPITIPGPLYGQDVRVTGADIFWKGETEFDVISAFLMRRQTGVCTTNSTSCFVNMIYITNDFTCDAANNPEGCTVSFSSAFIDNDVLTADSGILYLTIEFAFNSATSQIWIGGVRLTLEHD